MTSTTTKIGRPLPPRQTEEPPEASKRHWWVWFTLATLTLAIGAAGGWLIKGEVMSQPDPVPALTRDLENRGFSSVTRVEGGGEDRMVSIPGYNPKCRFLIKSDGGGGWTLTVPNSSTGNGTFEYPNPNAPQFAAKFPEQLKGCELAKS